MMSSGLRKNRQAAKGTTTRTDVGQLLLLPVFELRFFGRFERIFAGRAACGLSCLYKNMTIGWGLMPGVSLSRSCLLADYHPCVMAESFTNIVSMA